MAGFREASSEASASNGSQVRTLRREATSVRVGLGKPTTGFGETEEAGRRDSGSGGGEGVNESRELINKLSDPAAAGFAPG